MGDIIIEKSGGSPVQSTGRTAYIDQQVKNDLETIICSNFCTAFRVKPEYDPQFIFYYLRNIYHSGVFFQFESQTTGIKNLMLDVALKEIPLSDFDLQTQRRIATILSALDRKIILNNLINDNLEAMAKTIYHYRFVQNADEKWEKKTLSELEIDVIRGVTYHKQDIKNEKDKDVYGLLRATNITGHVLDLNDLVYVDASFVSENQTLNPFDILITMSSGSKEHVGKNGLYYFEDRKRSFGAFCSKIKVNEKYKYLIYMYLQSIQFRNYVKNICLGTNINNLNNEHITSHRLIIPDDDSLQLFNNCVLSFFLKIQKNTIENIHLIRLRDWLLPRLMNGQVSEVKRSAFADDCYL